VLILFCGNRVSSGHTQPTLQVGLATTTAGTRDAMSPLPQVFSTLREPLIKSGFLKGHGF
jgi:hypothetical protein